MTTTTTEIRRNRFERFPLRRREGRWILEPRSASGTFDGGVGSIDLGAVSEARAIAARNAIADLYYRGLTQGRVEVEAEVAEEVA